MRYADFGSISSGTMREEDLLQAFSEELDFQISRQPRSFRRAPYRALIREANKILAAIANGTDSRDDGSYDLTCEFFEALGEFAPPLAYFGSHPGDGADYGFWLLEDFQSCFDGLQVDDLNDIPRNYRGEVLHINDHGNATLYVAMSRGKLKEIWALV